MMRASSLLVLALLTGEIAHAEVTQASWYSVESCRREGTSGITASGERLLDVGYTCASWDYPLGTVLRVSYNSRIVEVTVNDRGPSKRLYRLGRRLDLSKRAFSELAPLERGVITVQIERVDN